MKVLGIIIGHDSSACLVEDGKIVRFIQEERFSRVKVGLSNAFESVRFCLGGMDIHDVDVVALSSGWEHSHMSHTHFQTLLKNKSAGGIPLEILRKGNDVGGITRVEHHDCHAASSYYTSGFSDALVVTVDGIGEKTTHSVYEGRGGSLSPLYVVRANGIDRMGADGVFRQRVFEKEQYRSIGWFYGMITEALGWRSVSDEGKTMGLAPYGNPDVIPMDRIRRFMYKVSPMGYYMNNGKTYYRFNSSNLFEKIAEEFGRENLAATAQKILEDKVMRMIRFWVKRTGLRRVCAAGGVFLNVKLNQRISEELGLEGFWPFPVAGDSGASIGAALHEYHRVNEYKPERIKHLYYGDEFSDEEIKRILDLAKIKYRRYDVEEVAGALVDNKIVGWFRGRMEGGPRALGGRSILMSPLRAENKDIINASVKFREAFRPFCPSVTREAANKHFDGGNEFMIIACNVRNDFIPAVTHVDGTARPQIVDRDVNPAFHRLIESFGEKTGVSVLLNTSLNVMGEPICRTPQDALRCFFSNGLDSVVIGNYVVNKGDQ